MAKLFNRTMQVNIGDLEISGRDEEGFAQPLLKMKFKAEAAVTSSPNKMTLEIWNLAKDSRTKVQTKGADFFVQAGYTGFNRVLFKGDVRFGSTSRQGTSWITKVQAGDGQKVYKAARVNANLAAGSQMADVLKAVGGALVAEGLDAGNLDTKADSGGVRAKLDQWVNGGVLSGKASQIMGKVCTSMGLQWSIQRGALTILEQEETTEDDPILLSPASGLVDSPEVGDDGKITAVSLLNGDIFPGRRIKIESAQLDGFFKCTKAVYTGDTWGGEWNTKIEARPIG